MDALLRSLFSRYSAVLQPNGVIESLGNAGGLSGCQLWRYPSSLGVLAVRLWPESGPDARTLERIHGWLADARSMGIVPVPIPARDGRSVQELGGRLWEIVPWMPGAAHECELPALKFVRGGFAMLATFHRTLARHATRGTSPDLVARHSEIAGLLASGFNRLELVLDQRRSDDPRVAIARQWLPLARRLAPRLEPELRWACGMVVPLQPCLRDIRPAHLLFVADQIRGLVDFGAMGVESVAVDLARLTSEWLGTDLRARAEALAAYEAIRPLDAAETALIPIFERSAALLGASRWVHWHFIEGRTFEDPNAVARGLELGLERILRLVETTPANLHFSG